MSKAFIRLTLALAAGVAVAGCSKQQTVNNETKPADKTGTAATQPTAGSPAADATPATMPATQAASAETGLSPIYTLPPSQGPAAHKFQQVTLLRSGPSGDLEMQLTGDGIYRIRDHGRGQSYAGNGSLTEEEIADWAKIMKDWETLKESYLPSPMPADADKIEIHYGGKKVLASSTAKDNPAVITEAYKRLLALNEKSKKESEVLAEATKADGEAKKAD